jgi:hypothetical protein
MEAGDTPQHLMVIALLSSARDFVSVTLYTTQRPQLWQRRYSRGAT